MRSAKNTSTHTKKSLSKKTPGCNGTESLFPGHKFNSLDFKNPHLTSHLITYIGNKRKLLPFLQSEFLGIQKELNKEKLIVLDGFAGSGVVSRLLKLFSDKLYVNDFEKYTEIVNKTYLSNRSEINHVKLTKYIDWLNENKLRDREQVGFIEKNYAPVDDANIKPGERVFYTNKNARIIDNIRDLIKEIPKPYNDYCLASLLIKASIHNNTSGVFKGFHKKDGIGHFGGKGENALNRIQREITLDVPIFSDCECDTYVFRKDTNELIRDKNLPEFDLAYFDPPYNQHPYGSNYFMLNIIAEGKPIEIQSGVSGITKEWQKSLYNKRNAAEEALDDLLENTKSKYILISYNDEGIIPISQFKEILSRHGKWHLSSQKYTAYRGSRNLQNRNTNVQELLWILKKK